MLQGGKPIRTAIKVIGIIFVGLVILTVFAAITDPEPSTNRSTATSNGTSSSQSTASRQPRVQDSPTRVPRPRSSPTPIPTPEPIYLSGFGDTALDGVIIPFDVAILTIRHVGDGHFAVVAFWGDDRELLVNNIGRYIGRNWLPDGEYLFDIDADGYWEITIVPIHNQEWIIKEGFSGIGDDVSGLFMPPETKVWEITHHGDGHFAVIAMCAGGRELIANDIGVISGSSVVSFPDGPCLLEVSANGMFSVKPR